MSESKADYVRRQPHGEANTASLCADRPGGPQVSIERMTQMKIDSTEPDWQARALAAEANLSVAVKALEAAAEDDCHHHHRGETCRSYSPDDNLCIDPDEWCSTCIAAQAIATIQSTEADK